MEIFWNYVSYFGFEVRFHDKYSLQPTCEHDCFLMEVFYKHHYKEKDLIRLSRVGKHKKVIKLSCIMLCDRRTINPAVLTTAEGLCPRKFSYEQPTHSDFCLWDDAICQISLPRLQLCCALGAFLHPAEQLIQWFLYEDENALFFQSLEDCFEVLLAMVFFISFPLSTMANVLSTHMQV